MTRNEGQNREPADQETAKGHALGLGSRRGASRSKSITQTCPTDNSGHRGGAVMHQPEAPPGRRYGLKTHQEGRTRMSNDHNNEVTDPRRALDKTLHEIATQAERALAAGG